jgi:abhydrolase domain-containing protein 12
MLGLSSIVSFPFGGGIHIKALLKEISVHGNAGDIVQGWRTETYRALYAANTSNIHILAIDYRGFGLSTGYPTEQGLIIDGIAAVNWALEIAKVPADRIVIVGQSLGTGVTAGVVEHFAKDHVDFAGVVLVAGFTVSVLFLRRWCCTT